LGRKTPPVFHAKIRAKAISPEFKRKNITFLLSPPERGPGFKPGETHKKGKSGFLLKPFLFNFFLGLGKKKKRERTSYFKKGGGLFPKKNRLYFYFHRTRGGKIKNFKEFFRFGKGGGSENREENFKKGNKGGGPSGNRRILLIFSFFTEFGGKAPALPVFIFRVGGEQKKKNPIKKINKKKIKKTKKGGNFSGKKKKKKWGGKILYPLFTCFFV